MVDIEKVIRAVDSCFDYWLDKHGYLRQLELERVRQIKADAITILKEPEAVEPEKEHSGSGVTWWNVCGNCKTAINPNDKFCHECGRRIKWE